MSISMDGTLGISSTGNIETDNYFLGNGAYLTGITVSTTYNDSNVEALLSSGNISNIEMMTGNIIPTANVEYSLGNATNQWKDLWVSNSTIYINSVPLSINGDNDLLVNNVPVVVSSNTSAPQTANISTTASVVAGNLVISNTTPGGGIVFPDGTVQTTASTGSSYGDSNVESLLSSGNLTSDITTSGNVTALKYYGDGSSLSNIVTGPANAIVNGSSNLSVALNGNIVANVNGATNVFTVGELGISVYGAVIGNLIVGDGGLLSNIQGTNVAGIVAESLQSNTSNIAYSVDGGNVVGAVSSSETSNVASVAYSVDGGNVVGAVASATEANTANVAYSVDGGNVIGAVALAEQSNTANIAYYVSAANVDGIVANAQHANIADNANVALSVDGANVTGQVANALVSGTVYENAQPNITSVGILSSLTVSGEGTFGNGIYVTGNITATGNLNYQDVTNLVVGDPIILVGANNTADIVDLGEVGRYDNGNVLYTGLIRDATDKVWKLFSNVDTEPTSVVDFTNAVYDSLLAGDISSTGNVVATSFTGDGSQLSSISGANVTGQVANAFVAQTVTDGAQPNITSVGTLSSLTVSGNISGDFIIGNGALLTGLPESYSNVNAAAYLSSGSVTNISATGNIVAGMFAGDGGLLTNIQVGAGTSITNGNSNVKVAANGNVSVSVSGTSDVLIVSSNTVSVAGEVIANSFNGNGSLLTDINGSAVVGYVNNANVANIARLVDGANVIGAVATATRSEVTNVANVASVAYSVSGSNVSGEVASAAFATSAGTATSIPVANVVGIGNIATLNLNGNSSTYLAGNGVWQTTIVPTYPQYQIWVAKNGNDSTGTGTLAAPYLTIQAAVNAANVAAVPTEILVAPGTYTGNISIASQTSSLIINGAGITQSGISGNITVSGTSTNISFESLRLVTGRMTHSATGYVSVNNMLFSANTGYTQTSTDVAKFYNVDLGGVGTGNVLITGGRFNFTNGQIFNLVVNNAAAEVNIFQSDGVINPTLTTGTLNLFDSILTSFGAGTNALTTTGGKVTIKDCSFINPDRTIARIGIGAGTQYSYGTAVFDRANSIISGTAVVIPGQFQSMYATGNVTAAYFLGNISQATGLGNISTVNLNGNASQLLSGNGTWVTPAAGYSNVDVSEYLASGTNDNNISTTANVSGEVGLFNEVNINNNSANVILFSDSNRNVSSTSFQYDSDNNDITGTGNISLQGNVTASFFIGDGSQLTGLPAGYTDSNVSEYLASGNNVNGFSTTGNVNSANVFTQGIYADALGNNVGFMTAVPGTKGAPNQLLIASAEGLTDGNPGIDIKVQAGNANESLGTTSYGGTIRLQAGDGSDGRGVVQINSEGGRILLGGTSDVIELNSPVQATNGIDVTGNITTTGILTDDYYYANGDPLVFSDYSDSNVSAYLSSGNNTSGFSTSGNVTAESINTASMNISGNSIVAAGNTIVIDPNGAGGADGEVIIAGNLQVLGNVTYVNANSVTTDDLVINVANNAANATQANGGGLEVGPAGNAYASLTYNSTSNVWNISNGAKITGALSAVGNITGAYFIGNGSQLTGIVSPASNTIINGTSFVKIASSGGAITANVSGTKMLSLSDYYVSIGPGSGQAGAASQSYAGVAIGYNAASNGVQGSSAVAIGADTGMTNQGSAAIAVGAQAGMNTQGDGGVAIGISAGQNTQGINSVAVGYYAGMNAQATNSIAIGTYAGNTGQNANSIAIGSSAGKSSMGVNSIAIGTNAGNTGSANNSIILNASGTNLPSTNSGFYVNPVRNDTGNVTNVLYFNSTTKEITYGPSSGGSYGNTDVSAYLASGNDTDGYATSGDIAGNNIVASSGLSSLGDGFYTGNITANAFIGDGSQLTGLPGGYSNAAVSTYLASGNNTSNIVTTGNLAAGTTITVLPNTVASFGANVDSYAQINLQNINGGANAEADFIITADNGNDTVNYADFGIVNSAYDPNTPTNALGNIIYPADTFLYAQGNTANVAQSGGNLAIGALTSGKLVKIFAGGANTNSLVATLGASYLAIGKLAGYSNQGNFAVAIGTNAGQANQTIQAVAIGYNAGQITQGQNGVALGVNAGSNTQSTNSIAIGTNAGQTVQGVSSLAIGISAGQTTQGTQAVALGASAGQGSQGNYAVAIGYNAGSNTQTASAVAIGYYAGQTTQGSKGIAIGSTAAQTNQGATAIAIGSGTGLTSQGTDSIAIGTSAASTTQGGNSVAVGFGAGALTQGNSAVSIGVLAGQQSQSNFGISIGPLAGRISQSLHGIAIGGSAGYTSQGQYSIAVGNAAGYTGQGIGAVAMGYSAGTTTQGIYSVAIGYGAGLTTQGSNSVAIGQNTGSTNQGNTAVALGWQSGSNAQGNSSIAIGFRAGYQTQGSNAIAIGQWAGYTSQGNNAIAIGLGAGPTQVANSIAINASGSNVAPTNSGFYVAPVRNDTGNTTNAVYYNTTTKEVTYGPAGGGGSTNLTQIDISGNITLTANQAGAYLYSTTTSPDTIIIPTNSNVAFANGTAITVVLQGNGSIQLTPEANVSLYLGGNAVSANRTISPYGIATLLKVSTDTWFINGTGVN